MDTIFLAFLVAVGNNMVLSGSAGWVLARRRGVSPLAGAVAGALLPWVGLIVPAVMRPVVPISGLTKPEGPQRLVCAGLVVAGLLGILISAFNEWATLSGSVNAAGEEFGEKVSGGPGDTVVGLGLLLLTVAVSAALLAGHLLHGGLRFSLFGLGLAGTFASVVTFGVIGSEVVSDVSSMASRWSAGHAEAQVELGMGAIAAVIGTSLLSAGWMVGMSGRQAVGAAGAIVNDPWSNPVPSPQDVWSTPPALPVNPWVSTSATGTASTSWSPPTAPGSGPQPPTATTPGQPPAGW